jgi:hypothetical protein
MKTEKEIWTLPKKELEDALNLVLSVPTRNGISSSEYIQVCKHDGNKAIMFLSADLSGCAFVTGDKPFPFKKPIYLDRRVLEPFVIRGKESKISEYTFRIKNDVLLIKHGSRTASYVGQRAGTGYHTEPVFDNGKSLMMEDKLTEMLKCAAACATNDPIMPMLNGVHMISGKDNKVWLYSTNTKVIFRAEVEVKHPPKRPVVFPLLLADLITKHNMPKLIWDDKKAMLSSPRGSLWQGVKKEALTGFPVKRSDEFIEEGKSGKLLFRVNAESLSRGADNLNNYLSAVTREDLVLKMIITPNEKRMMLQCGAGSATFTEQVALVKPSKEACMIEWPLEEVLPVLVFSKDEGEARVYASADTRTLYTTKSIHLVIAKKDKKGK